MRVLIALIAGYLGYRLVKKGYDMTQPQDIYMAKTIWGEAGARGRAVCRPLLTSS